jgi:thiamine biosynthesis lipoprotein
LLLAAVLVACHGAPKDEEASLQVFVSEPVGVMGTQTSLAVVLPREEANRGREILGSVEAELRRIEALMSTWIEESEISRLNAAPEGEPVPLSAASLEVLRVARQLFDQTKGAFDVTCRPLIERWRLAGDEGRLPTEEDLAERRLASDWSQIDLTEQGARKSRNTASVDLSGIAKGYAIDQALLVMRRSGAAGGLVEVGGDLRVFGVGPEGEDWSVGIRSPLEDRAWGEMKLGDGAVCTSGDYARYVEIDGQRYSEVIDPRSGRPAESSSSVTVVAGDAMTADAWATALTVLGPAGLELLPAGERVEALIVSSDESGEFHVQASDGFSDLLFSSEFALDETSAGLVP